MNIDREFEQLVCQIAEEALEDPAASREAFLDRACAGRAALRKEVGAFLTSMDSVDHSLLSPQLRKVMGGVDATLDAAAEEGVRDASDPQGERPMAGGTSAAARPGAPLDSGSTGADDASRSEAADARPSAERRAPSYDNDPDTFRRQICEAARQESDPELRAKLEKECHKYDEDGE